MVDIYDPDKEDNKGGQPSIGPAPMGAQQPQKMPQQGTRGGGRFQNLQRFIQANQGAGQRLGGQIQSGIQRQGQQARQAIGSQQAQMQQQQQSEMDRLQAGRQFIGQAVQSPTGLGQQDIERFQTLRQQQGATQPQFTGTAAAQQQIGQLGQTQGLTQSEQGRFGLLRSTFGLPGYSRGAARLDQLLLQSDPTQIRQLGGVAEQEQEQIRQSLAGAQTQEQQLQEQLAQEVADVGQFATESALGAEEALRQDLATRLAAEKPLDVLRGALGGQEITREQADELGLGPEGRLYGMDLSEFERLPQATKETIATEEDIARAQRLGQLLGREQRVFGDISRAGEYGTSAKDVLGRFKEQLAARRGEYEQAAAVEPEIFDIASQENIYDILSEGFGDSDTRFGLDDPIRETIGQDVNRLRAMLSQQGITDLSPEAIESLGLFDPQGTGQTYSDVRGDIGTGSDIYQRIQSDLATARDARLRERQQAKAADLLRRFGSDRVRIV